MTTHAEHIANIKIENVKHTELTNKRFYLKYKRAELLKELSAVESDLEEVFSDISTWELKRLLDEQDNKAN